MQTQYIGQCDVLNNFVFAFFQDFSVTRLLREDDGKGKGKALEAILRS